MRAQSPPTDLTRTIEKHFIALDEFAGMAPSAWTEVLRPMLSDRKAEHCSSGTRSRSWISRIPLRTHVAIALGYMITAEFPMSSPGGYRSEFIA